MPAKGNRMVTKCGKRLAKINKIKNGHVTTNSIDPNRKYITQTKNSDDMADER